MPTRTKPTAPRVTPEERIYAQAAIYGDEEGTLGDSAIRALRARQARSGKLCGRCGEKKPLSAFSRDASQETGLRRTCRLCANTAERARVNG